MSKAEVAKKILTSEPAKKLYQKIAVEGVGKIFDAFSKRISKSNSDGERLDAAIETMKELGDKVEELALLLAQTREEVAAAKAEAAKPWWKKW